MSNLITRPPRYWLMSLLVAQAIYLVFELAFNARLVDSIIISDETYFDQLSYIGRCISGVGMALLCYTLIRYVPDRPLWRTLSFFLLSASIAFPVMFFGQEKMIDYFVEKSSADQRMHAQYLMLLKKGLANNAVVLKGIEYEKEDLDRPAIKTFISNLGFMVFFTPDYIQAVMQNSDQILQHIAHQKSSKELDKYYPDYIAARVDIEKSMTAYNKANSLYVERLNEVPKQAEDIWRDTFAELKDQWQEIEKKSNRESIEDSLDRLVNGLEQYRLGKESCRQRNFGRALCLEKLQEAYQQKMQFAFSQAVDPEYWCTIIPGKMAYVMQGNSFIEQRQPDRVVCDDLSRDFLRLKMLQLKGMENDYFASWEAFISSKSVADKVRKKLKDKEIFMPESYRIRSRKSFISGVSSELTRLLKGSFMEQTSEEFGESIAPLLNQQSFFELPMIQQPLKKSLRLSDDHAPVALNLSEVQFQEQILIPIVTKELEKQRGQLLASSVQYANGAEKEHKGKQYVRSILIPPIAMGLSMFFALLNFSAVAAGIAALSGAKQSIISMSRVAFIIVIIIVPLRILPGEIARTQTFQSIVEQTTDAIGPVGSEFIIWLSNLQPVIYPLGYFLADNLSVFSPKTDQMPLQQ